MKTQDRQRLLLIAAIACLALLAADRFVFDPLTAAWKNRSSEISRLRNQVADGRSLIQREGSILGRWDRMRTNMLPDNPSIAQEQVLKTLVNWAQESNVSINAITPQWKNDADEYKTLVCRVDAAGSIWSLSRFLYDIENGPLALKLESAAISSRDNSGQQLSLALQISGLALSTSKK